MRYYFTYSFFPFCMCVCVFLCSSRNAYNFAYMLHCIFWLCAFFRVWNYVFDGLVPWFFCFLFFAYHLLLLLLSVLSYTHAYIFHSAYLLYFDQHNLCVFLVLHVIFCRWYSLNYKKSDHNLLDTREETWKLLFVDSKHLITSSVIECDFSVNACIISFVSLF